MRTKYVHWLPLAACLTLRASSPVGIFADHTDVGAVVHAGSVEYDAARHSYTIAGSGENMWFASDAFQFVWKKVSGDVTLTADVAFAGTDGVAHRKAVLMIRQSLDTDAAYADIARHGDGLTSLQIRDEKGQDTHEVQAAMTAPKRLRLVKRGDSFYMWLAGDGEEFHFAGASTRIQLQDPFYVGIGVCSHDKDTVARAVFSNVELAPGAPQSVSQPVLYSTLETVPLPGGDRRATYVAAGRLAAPFWTRDGSSLIFQHDGHLERVSARGGHAEVIDAATAGSLHDASESPGEAEYVYFQAERSGRLQIWRRRRDGSGEEQVISDSFQNCYPHVSPDGRHLAFLSFAGDAPRIPEDSEVMLRVLSLKDNKTTVVARMAGGKGTLEASPWSPDGRRLSFISYHLVP